MGFEQIGTDMGAELAWDDTIEKENEFILLPEGEYAFRVASFERSRYPGSDKIGPCNQAKIVLEVESPEGLASIRHNLFLHSKCEGLLCAFFRGIGQKKHGEKLKMDWNKVMGSIGRAKIGIRIYDGKKFNEVKQFIYPDEETTQPTTFKPGSF